MTVRMKPKIYKSRVNRFRMWVVLLPSGYREFTITWEGAMQFVERWYAFRRIKGDMPAAG